jgi:hypothetical protein
VMAAPAVLCHWCSRRSQPRSLSWQAIRISGTAGRRTQAAKITRQKTGRRAYPLTRSGACGRGTGYPLPRRLQTVASFVCSSVFQCVKYYRGVVVSLHWSWNLKICYFDVFLVPLVQIRLSIAFFSWRHSRISSLKNVYSRRKFVVRYGLVVTDLRHLVIAMCLWRKRKKTSLYITCFSYRSYIHTHRPTTHLWCFGNEQWRG